MAGGVFKEHRVNFKYVTGLILGGFTTLALAGDDTGSVDGEAVYDRLCMACHQTGVAGAPMRGDDEAWAPRLEQGMETLVVHAIDGINAMPPRGGNPNLSDDEVRAATHYLLAPLIDAPLDPVEASPGEPVADEPVADAPGDTASALDGEALYARARCATCHATGIAGSPVLGDIDAWRERLEKGREALYQSVILGKGVMPPRGASTADDDELEAMVDYMIERSQ